jgi:hypothetical protein
MPMNPQVEPAQPAGTFEDLERAQLRAWTPLDTAAKVDFFGDTVAIAYLGGALSPKHRALRDRALGSTAQDVS